MAKFAEDYYSQIYEKERRLKAIAIQTVVVGGLFGLIGGGVGQYFSNKQFFDVERKALGLFRERYRDPSTEKLNMGGGDGTSFDSTTGAFMGGGVIPTKILHGFEMEILDQPAHKVAKIIRNMGGGGTVFAAAGLAVGAIAAGVYRFFKGSEIKRLRTELDQLYTLQQKDFSTRVSELGGPEIEVGQGRTRSAQQVIERGRSSNAVDMAAAAPDSASGRNA